MNAWFPTQIPDHLAWAAPRDSVRYEPDQRPSHNATPIDLKCVDRLAAIFAGPRTPGQIAAAQDEIVRFRRAVQTALHRSLLKNTAFPDVNDIPDLPPPSFTD